MKEKINQKNIFVTGCAGFIGFHICKALIKRGDMVVGVDNLNHYYDIKLKKNRLKVLTIISKKNKSSFIFKKTDITNKKELSKIFKRFKFDRVIHLAAQAGVRYSLKNPDTYIQKANGTPRQKAFTQNFINEEGLTFVEIGALYGYPYYMSKELDEINR